MPRRVCRAPGNLRGPALRRCERRHMMALFSRRNGAAAAPLKGHSDLSPRRRSADPHRRNERSPRVTMSWIERALCGAILGLILAWIAVAVLSSVDIDSTADLFAAMGGSVSRLLHHI